MKPVSSSISSTRLEDLFSSLKDFEEILIDARMNASTDFEEGFVRTTQANYDQYSGRMFWSEKQDQILRSIAGPEDY